MSMCVDKAVFESQYEAHKALTYIAEKALTKRRPKVPQRAYECPYCGGWHLTSMPRRRIAKDAA